MYGSNAAIDISWAGAGFVSFSSVVGKILVKTSPSHFCMFIPVEVNYRNGEWGCKLVASGGACV